MPFPDQHGEEIEYLRLNRPEPPGPAQLEPVEIKLAVAEDEDHESSLPRTPPGFHQCLTGDGHPLVSRSSPFFLQACGLPSPAHWCMNPNSPAAWRAESTVEKP